MGKYYTAMDGSKLLYVKRRDGWFLTFRPQFVPLFIGQLENNGRICYIAQSSLGPSAIGNTEDEAINKLLLESDLELVELGDE